MAERMTDERLDEIEARFRAGLHDGWQSIDNMGQLIRALKAERQEVANLKSSGLALCRAIGKEAPAAEQRIKGLTEEVERLQESNAALVRVDISQQKAIEAAERKLARVRELPGKWRSRLFDSRTNGLKGLDDCADELEAALQSAAGPGSNQPEVDETGNNTGK